MDTSSSKRIRDAAGTRRQLVAAATRLMMRQGFAATTVDQICAEAGLSKGSFFHNFASKEAVGLEAMAGFAKAGMDLYAAAAGEGPGADPLAELHRLLDIMAGLVEQHGDELMCMVGMLAQELSATNATVREAAAEHMNAWVEMVARLLVKAQQRHRPQHDFDATEVAWTLYSIWQGSMLIGKTLRSPATIAANLGHGRRYLDLLFTPRARVRTKRPARSE
ncbi:MAG TPA: TetR/AcrR family transcriptional regulator [Nannocystis sp.]|jgi:TetR/AcrR family transcriptional repressor of nem operon